MLDRREHLGAMFDDAASQFDERRDARAPGPSDPSVVGLDSWEGDLVRHEALLNRAVMKGHRLLFVAADS